MGREIITRKDAICRKLNRYFTGRPCKRGHTVERYIDGRCLKCLWEWTKIYDSRLSVKTRRANGRKNPKIKKRILSYQRRWRKTPQGQQSTKIWNYKYSKTQQGRDAHKRARQARRARKLGCECVPYTLKEVKIRFSLWSGCCYCGETNTRLVEDHFIPLSKNGSHKIENIVPACNSCNSQKFNKDPKEWFEQQSFYSRRRWNKIVKVLNL